MKILKYTTVLLMTLALFACQKDEDPQSNTSNNGTGTDSRDKFVGTWTVNETSTIFGTSAYQVDIAKHSSISNRIVIDNFYNLGFTASHCQVEVSGNNFNIPQQTISGYTITGSGNSPNNNTINFTYFADDGASIDTVNSVFTKN
jgi:hypothetical protein